MQGVKTMKTVLNPNQSSVSRNDLLDLGFSDTQINHFESLRAMYPYIEFFDSRQEWQRVQFMKWMVSREMVAVR
jgi:hypothetical protein